MTASDRYQWRRDRDGLGVWEHPAGRAMVLIANLRYHLGKLRVDTERRRDGGIA
jgi:hypothetical protein